MNKIIKIVLLGSAMIIGMSACGTKREHNATIPETIEETTTVEESTTIVEESTTIEETMTVEQTTTELSGYDSVEELVSTYIGAIEDSNWDLVLSMYEQLSLDTDGIYKAYTKEGRTDLVGVEYDWEEDYEIIMEEDCEAKVIVNSPIFYPEESDYYDSVLAITMKQRNDARWYLYQVELEGKVKEYEDLSQWNYIQSYEHEWLPILEQELEDDSIKEWTIENATTDLFSTMFYFEVKIQLEDDSIQYKTISIMCLDGVWSIVQ